jgi:tetratricopeptide (TPR) repeat protein
VWGQARRDAVATALGAAAPGYASMVWPRVQEQLDRYAKTWQATHREACQAHLRGERSGALLDQQMRCLDQRLRALDEAVETFAAADADVALRALEVAGDLPPLEACRNLEALDRASPPPEDPERAARAAELRGQMARVEVLAHSGRLRDALAWATELVDAAEALDYPPVRAEALLLRGKLELNLSEDADDRVGWLTRAISAGFEARADAIAAEAMARRIFALGRHPDLVDQALADESVALALADRAPNPGALRGLVLNNIGTAYKARQAPEKARRYFSEALALREAALGPKHREVAYTLVNLASVSEPGPGRQPLLARALAILEVELGPAHPEALELRLAAAHLVDPGEGPAMLRPGCATLDRFLAEDVARRARCLLHLGRLALEVGDDDEADVSFLAAAELSERAARAALPLTEFEVAALAGYAALARGGHDAAIATIRAALTALPDAWWARADAAELHLLLGLNLLAADRPAEARESLEASVAHYADLVSTAPEFNAPLARARRSLAEALLALGAEDREEAREQVGGALAFYRGAGTSFERQFVRTERLAARLRGPQEAAR